MTDGTTRDETAERTTADSELTSSSGAARTSELDSPQNGPNDLELAKADRTRPGGTTSSTAAAPAEPDDNDWPSFRGGDLQRGVAGSDLPDQLELLWKLPAADGVVATAAIVDDRVYVPCLNGHLLCLDRNTGREIWKYRS
ncbi:MAG: PQQ-binding-like beta-propeller repeat protein, partial [Planctomycetaceae bacterium]